jgi:hypothetical protein
VGDKLPGRDIFQNQNIFNQTKGCLRQGISNGILFLVNMPKTDMMEKKKNGYYGLSKCYQIHIFKAGIIIHPINCKFGITHDLQGKHIPSHCTLEKGKKSL